MRWNAGGLAYGTITVGAVLAVESASRETYAETVAAAIVALLLYWLAHTYMELVRQRVEAHRPGTTTALWSVLLREAWILLGAAGPLLALVVCWVAGVALSTAISISTWVAAAMVVLLELGLALWERLPRQEAAVQTSIGLTLGLLVIALRALLH